MEPRLNTSFIYSKSSTFVLHLTDLLQYTCLEINRSYFEGREVPRQRLCTPEERNLLKANSRNSMDDTNIPVFPTVGLKISLDFWVAITENRD